MLTQLIMYFLLVIVPKENTTSSPYDPCQVYGRIFITNDAQQAHFRVFIESSEAFADVLVFEQDNYLYADRAGQWSYVSNYEHADAYIYFEKNRNLADFSIFYTDVESFAGCNQ